MNILLWILQSVLAFLYLSGGGYKTFKFDELANRIGSLPRGGWRLLGVVEMAGAILLIVPAALKWMPHLTPLAAVVLTLETVGLCGLYARKSVKLTAANPLVFAVPMALLAAFVAYGRYELVPLA
jgi:hypothetical protein